MNSNKNTEINAESIFSSTSRMDGSVSASQSLLGTVVDNVSLVVVAEKNGMPISARHFNIEKGKENKIILGSEILASMPDRVVFDLKVGSSTPSNESGFGGIFRLGDPPVLFSVPSNSPVSVNEINNMVSVNKTRGILAVNISPLWRRGYFPFTMAINILDSATPGRIGSVPKEIMSVYSENRAGNFFDALDVEVRENANGAKILSVIENRREEIQEVLRTESTDPGNCGKPCVHHSANLDKYYFDSGDVSSVDLYWKVKTDIAPSYNGFIIEDGVYSESITSNYSYRGNTFRQVSKLSISMYNFNNTQYAYDQLVVKKILSSGSDESRVHPLVEINDPFMCMEAFPDPSIPIVELRNDSSSLSEDAYAFSSKNPYLIYINAYRIRSSNKFAPAISLTSATSTENVSLSVSLLRENGKIIRGKNDIGLVFTTTIGSDNNLKSFTNFIRVKTSPSGGAYGSSTTYGSGNSLPDQGWPYKDVTVGDLFELIKNNIAGNIVGDLPEDIDIVSEDGYRGGQSCTGLIPTFAECGLPSLTPNQPIFTVYPSSNLSACYGLPAHRIWLGNTDGSVGDLATELYESNVNSQQGSPVLSIYSRGPEKGFDLHNFTLAMPLARGSSRAFMRSSIKEYASHAADGDFGTLRANRFYPLRSISDAVDFLRHGSEYWADSLGLVSNVRENLNPSGLAAGRRVDGERRPCIGASKIGIGIDYCCGNSFEPINFYKQVGSYFMSSLAQTEPFRMTNSSVSLRVSKFNRQGNGSIFICYSPGRMFNSPRSGFDKNASNDIFVSKAARTGGEWHVLYSTLANDYFGGIKYTDPGVSGYSTLNPFIHGSEASLKSEGGVQGRSSRRVYINPCVDFRGSAFKIGVDNIGYDFDDFCRSTDRFGGNVQRFVNSDNMGSVAFPVSGPLEGVAKIKSSYPFEAFDSYINDAKYKTYENKFGNIMEFMNDSLGWSVSYLPSSVLAKEDKVPFESIRLELLNRPVAPEEFFPEPYGIEPYYIEPYGSEPYGFALDEAEILNNKSGYINTGNLYNPYTFYEPYDSPYFEPYSYASNPIYTQILLRSNRIDDTECSLGYIPVLSIVKIIKDARRFDFNLNDRKNRSVYNLIQSVEDRLGPFGIHANSSVSNPESFISSKIFTKERSTILDTRITTINEVEEVLVPIENGVNANFDPYLNFEVNINGIDLRNAAISYEPYMDPYGETALEPYAGYIINYIKKPKPVLSTVTGISSFSVAVDTIDPSFSGSFSIDFDFNVSRRSTPSNALLEDTGVVTQRPRSDPAVRSLITGSPVAVKKETISQSQSVNASQQPSKIAGEQEESSLFGGSSEELRRKAIEEIIRRQK